MMPNVVPNNIGVVAAALCLLASINATASSQRTFVSVVGADNPACSLALPCRTFGAAVAAANAGAEVIVLESGGYGAVTITKSISISSPPGIYAGVSVPSGDGIAVNGNGIAVTLRGLSIKGIGGATGIHFLAGAVLHIANCEISGFVGTGNSGIRIDAPDAVVHVDDTIVRDNQNGVIVAVQDEFHNVVGTMSRSRLENNATEGIFFLGSAQFSIEDSVVAGSQYNIDAYPLVFGANVDVSIARTLVQRGSYGVYAEPNASGAHVSIWVADSTIASQIGYGIAAIPLQGNTFVWVTRSQIFVDPTSGQPVAVVADAASGGGAGISIDAITAAGAYRLSSRQTGDLSIPARTTCSLDRSVRQREPS